MRSRSLLSLSTFLLALGSFGAALTACPDPCTMNDPRPVCNSKGNPDLANDAGGLAIDAAPASEPAK